MYDMYIFIDWKIYIYKEYINVLIFWNIIVMILFVCKILVNYNKSVLFFGVRVSLVLFFV